MNPIQGNTLNLFKTVLCLVLFCTGASSFAQSKLYKNTFDLDEVTLLEGPLQKGRDLNIEVLLQYDVDRLLAPYRIEAGLEPISDPYANWAGLDAHVGGHYLSAMAMNYAATGNEACKKRMDYMIAQLDTIQQANAVNNPSWGVGYLGGMPNSEKVWSTLKKGDLSAYKQSWAPWYNIHKMYAGLRDAWLYADDERAKRLFLKYCDWGMAITADLDAAKMEEMLDVEHGGMNEIFADAYQISGDPKYLEAAKRFSHKRLLNPLAEGNDILNNMHANTQIPKFVGFSRIAELANAEKYEDASQFFWKTVVENRSLAFGGNSRREHFPSKASSIDYVNVIDGPETCNSYNMLKLTEDLFRINPQARYAEFYERTLFNHIRSSQHPEHGGYVYFTSTRPRHYRVYSAPNEAMWCCVGTGMENHGKYNQFIYTHSENALYVNLFVASEVNWSEKSVSLKQTTNFPEEEQTRLKITKGNAAFDLNLRYPSWAKADGFSITVNGKSVEVNVDKGSYVTLSRNWKKGDVVVVQFPMENTTVAMPNVPEYQAFMHGPILLGAKTGTQDLNGLIAGDGRWGQYPSGKFLPVDQAPILITEKLSALVNQLEPIANKPLHFTLDTKVLNSDKNLELEPFANIHDARYMTYWLSLTPEGYTSYTDSLAALEKRKIEIENRTLDYVATGEQQPETDHNMQEEKSRRGNANEDFFREAPADGYFSYEFATNSQTDLSLLVRYWGAEWGGRKFDIYIDDQKLVTEDNTKRWEQSLFKDMVYEIPNELVKGKKQIRVKFQALPYNTAGAVYSIRLLRSEK
ncbi:hypothetical protein DSM03_10799 [Leeuwenhoekiella aestuarii]|uniref:DUF1680 family protein n=1 Tax=Leeuwenhoekiella aestuarii TaxID=2249426 RepID=A0A4Q0NQ17_9FLAO|nr:beta-L-arabinofuranosidase domain-containing protein [Leeuwenhoekiella aestuarii]RXG12002.1 hypothetical protein DSM04_10899 [Leeuwenhoekiella aestuarii]RXG13560.1 hypothetical protein DSM03_10799 [Leeuwenhoekiella aestuarii]